MDGMQRCNHFTGLFVAATSLAVAALAGPASILAVERNFGAVVSDRCCYVRNYGALPGEPKPMISLADRAGVGPGSYHGPWLGWRGGFWPGWLGGWRGYWPGFGSYGYGRLPYWGYGSPWGGALWHGRDDYPYRIYPYLDYGAPMGYEYAYPVDAQWEIIEWPAVDVPRSIEW